MVIVELHQPDIAQAVLASLRPGATTDKLLAVAVELSTKLTTHIEDFERLANDVLLAVWDRLEAATSGEDAGRPYACVAVHRLHYVDARSQKGKGVSGR